MIAIVFAILNSSFARAESWVLPDFKLTDSPRVAVALNEDCRANIKNVICLVDPIVDPGDDRPRPCLPGGGSFAKPLEDVYDLFPRHLQKMFCHLSRINVEDDFIGSAYGGLELEADKKTIRGGLIGIRSSLLKGDVSLNTWASWKEQTHFGADPKKIEALPGLPRVIATRGEDPRMMLYFLVAHEFAHIFDFVNGVNQTEPCDLEHCPVKAGTYGAISFSRHQEPLPQFDFPLRPALCFYFCEGIFIPADRQEELYRDLAKTNFLTPYTTRYEQEDFADSLAMYTLKKELNLDYKIQVASGALFDITRRLDSTEWLSKKRYLEKFLASKYRYPERGLPIRNSR